MRDRFSVLDTTREMVHGSTTMELERSGRQEGVGTFRRSFSPFDKIRARQDRSPRFLDGAQKFASAGPPRAVGDAEAELRASPCRCPPDDKRLKIEKGTWLSRHGPTARSTGLSGEPANVDRQAPVCWVTHENRGRHAIIEDEWARGLALCQFIALAPRGR